jgi:hypothetical protein
MVNSIQHHHHKANSKDLGKKTQSKNIQRVKGVLNSDAIFRRKYTGFLITSVFGAVLFFMSVVLYNTVSNYEIFKRLAYLVNPELVSHIERELTGVYILYFAGLTSILGLCFLVGYKITKNVGLSLHKVQKHFNKISKHDWSAKDFHYSLNDDHSDFLSGYAVFYRELRAESLDELDVLESIKNDTKDPNIRARIQDVCLQKRKKLGLKFENTEAELNPIVSDGTSGLPASVRELRRVS